MKSILVAMDETTLETLNRIAPPETRKRMQFLREAIRRAIVLEVEKRARAGYAALPDSESEADDWSTAEEFRP